MTSVCDAQICGVSHRRRILKQLSLFPERGEDFGGLFDLMRSVDCICRCREIMVLVSRLVAVICALRTDDIFRDIVWYF